MVLDTQLLIGCLQVWQFIVGILNVLSARMGNDSLIVDVSLYVFDWR